MRTCNELHSLHAAAHIAGLPHLPPVYKARNQVTEALLWGSQSRQPDRTTSQQARSNARSKPAMTQTAGRQATQTERRSAAAPAGPGAPPGAARGVQAASCQVVVPEPPVFHADGIVHLPIEVFQVVLRQCRHHVVSMR